MSFHKELRRRVDDYFRSSDRSPRDCPAMYLKTAIILAAFGGFYSLLVFVAGSWWQALPLSGSTWPVNGGDWLQYRTRRQSSFLFKSRLDQPVGGHDDGSNRRQFLRMALETRSRTSYLRKHHGP